MTNSTARFSNRVEDYVRSRPHYPQAILSYLHSEYSFEESWDVADIGSGTGISTELFLKNGNRVYAVEPNREMRTKAEELLAGYPGFISIDGTAEATGLAAGSIDLIVAGQAFHWFDAVKSRKEFLRILKPAGAVALIWNERLTESPFEREYEALIRHHSTDYERVDHRNITDDVIDAFFSPAAFELVTFPNEQLFDLAGLKSRLLSSSYIPKEGADYTAMITELEGLFAAHESGGQVRVGYTTKVYSGMLHSL